MGDHPMAVVAGGERNHSMDRSAIIAGIKSALAEVLQGAVPEVFEETSLFGDLYLDSTSVLELLMAMEDTLGIEVDPEDLQLETFKTIGTLADYVSEALGAGIEPVSS
jgi:acyl carrier protein